MGKNRNKVLRGVIGFGMGKIRKGDMSVENQIYKLQAAAVCHRGRVRANNEDNLFFDHKILREQHEGIQGCLTAEESTGQPQLMGVFDGMGGHAKGEKASWMMAGTVGRRFDGKKPEKPEELIPEFLIDLCMKTNADVCKEMEKAKSRIGTTASMLYFYQDAVWVCNIGDSPIYCYRGDVLEEIYQEHTERLLRQKIYGEENVKGKKFPLTQHIGIFPDEMKIQPYTASIPLQEGDQYLICSDGLTDMPESGNISRCWRKSVKKQAC